MGKHLGAVENAILDLVLGSFSQSLLRQREALGQCLRRTGSVTKGLIMFDL